MRDAAGDDRQEWMVTGMTCAGCTRKVEQAVSRLEGVADVAVMPVSGRLSLRLSGSGEPPPIERTVRRLGYGIAPATGPDAPADPSTPVGTVRRSLRNPALARVAVTGALLAGATVVSLAGSGTTGDYAFAAACLIALVPVAWRALVMFAAGQPFTIEALMTIAAGGALLIGAAGEAALVIFLFAIGEMLEGLAAGRARASIKELGNLVPRTALLVSEGAPQPVAATDLRIGQTVLARPGDRIPADGEIVSGTSSLDESPVTGESVPAAKGPRADVFAGSINREAALHIRVTRAHEDTTIARIIRLVEEAEAARAPTERFIARFSRIYMPTIVGLAAMVALGPPLLAGAPWLEWTYRALALLLIGCPCALVISVPASIASALSAGARSGLLMKGGAVIETAARVTRVAFDKTGTLTLGRPTVTDVIALGGTEAEVIALAAAVEMGSAHPLAEAILARAEAEGAAIAPANDARPIPGRGVVARVGGARVIVGTIDLAREETSLPAEALTRAGALEAEGKTVAVVLRDGEAVGLIGLRDAPRADASAGIAALRRLGVNAVMLSGDDKRPAVAIAEALGIDHRARLMPDAKLAAIREMAAAEPVMMIGDGINDAPALAAAHVGVAMGSGTDVALETADGALMRNRVGDVAALIRLARAAMANIRQNIAIALGLKGVFLVTTIAGLTGLWPAILADTGATVLVTLNALRLLGFEAQNLQQPISD